MVNDAKKNHISVFALRLLVFSLNKKLIDIGFFIFYAILVFF